MKKNKKIIAAILRAMALLTALLLTESLQRLALVDHAYQTLLTGDARALLIGADCAQVRITWGSEPLEPIESIMRMAGLR